MDICRKLQLAQLDLLLELKRICEKNNIHYFLVGGTLIGAARHQGFIPWDDDIDVGMLRHDYEHFLDACRTDLSEEYRLYDWTIDKYFPLAFAKLKIKGTKMIEDISKNSDICDEVFIDVFPFDSAPDDSIRQKIHSVHVIVLRKVLLIKCGYRLSEQRKGIRKVVNKALYKLLEILFTGYSTDEIKSLYQVEQEKYNRTNTSYYINLNGAYSYQRELKQKILFERFTQLEFEKNMLSVPEKYDQYLTEVYGDYMKMPPEEQRVPRHNIGIDLGHYKIKNKVYEEEVLK